MKYIVFQIKVRSVEKNKAWKWESECQEICNFKYVIRKTITEKKIVE